MDLSSPLAKTLRPEARAILEDAPESNDLRQSNGVKLVVDALVRCANEQMLFIEDDSTSDISQGFIDLLVEENSPAHPVSSKNLSGIMNVVNAVAASNGVHCHFVLQAHISYDPVEE